VEHRGERMSDFFTADHHFGHFNIIKHCGRPFTTLEEMDGVLIENWNSVVGPKDNVYILGDFFWNSNTDYCWNIIKKLNGYKYLIVGSHDKFLSKKEALKSLFVWTKKYHVYKNNDIRAVLFHNPIYDWDKMELGAYHFFGHVHQWYVHLNGNLKTYNVGVDVNNFKPVSLESILKILEGEIK
jgi:calcineurin-like phosphoesterase family protein